MTFSVYLQLFVKLIFLSLNVNLSFFFEMKFELNVFFIASL